MRKFFISWLACVPVLAASWVFADTYSQTVESYKPIAYYQFSNSNPTGSSVTSPGGAVYSGTLDGSPAATTNSTGPAIADDPGNTALNLTGNGTSGAHQQYFDTNIHANTTDEINQSGTILAWINLASLPSDDGRIYYIAGESTYGDDFDLQINNDNTIRFYTEGGGNTATAALTSANLNQWIFVAATFTAGSDRTIYINGVSAGTSTPGGHSASSTPFSIGASDVFGNRYFDGSIDEVAFYNTDLSATDIADIYASAPLAATSGVPLPSSFYGGLVLLGTLLACRKVSQRPAR